MTWKLISFSKLGMPLPPRKSGYALGILENSNQERQIAQIEKRFCDNLKIGTLGTIEKATSFDGEINMFVPKNYKEKKLTRVALVTGSTTGLGKAIALALAQDGFEIIVNDENHSTESKKAAAEIKKISKKSIYIQADVSNTEQVEKMVQEIIKKFGRLDVLVNNSGIARDKTLDNMSSEDWDAVIAVNLKGVFNCTKSAISHMRQQGYGRIISISSVAGEIGSIGKANYAASKGAILAFTKTVAKEYAGDNITANAIAPGLIKTKMVEAIPKKIINEMIKQIPLGHLGDPKDIGNIVAFLTSDKASYITGQVFNINGGLYM